MNVCFYFSDKFIFPLFEGAFLFLFVYALLHEKGFLRNQSNLKLSVEKGKESWGNFTLAFGIASIIVLMQIINSADALHGYKTIISIVNLLMLIYLIFFNGWFRNKVIGLIIRSQKKIEK
jgi:thiosulfate reductase cytochrome b subunit